MKVSITYPTGPTYSVDFKTMDLHISSVFSKYNQYFDIGVKQGSYRNISFMNATSSELRIIAYNMLIHADKLDQINNK